MVIESIEALQQFRAKWSTGIPPSLAQFLRLSDDEDYIRELISVDLENRWKQLPDRLPQNSIYDGFPQYPFIEDYSRILGGLGLPVSLDALVASEYRVRRLAGDHPSRTEYCTRFPALAVRLSSNLKTIDDNLSAEVSRVASSDTSSNVAWRTDTVSWQPKERSGASPAVPDKPPKIGKYQATQLLGRGGFGEVWLAEHPQLKRTVAIKTPRLDRDFSAEQLQDFLQEGQKLASLDEISGIVKVYDADEDNGVPYLVYDFIDGENLNDRISRAPLSFNQGAEIIRALARTLHQAHLRGLTHRDIKPANILLDRKSSPYLADFGLAVMEQEQWREGPGILGTYSYMSPEQVRGDSHLVDGRADIFSLGMVFYQLLTGRLPYVSGTREGYVAQILAKEPRPPRMINDQIPESLEHICLKCLKKGIAERYSTASDLVRDLDRALQVKGRRTSPAWISGCAATALLIAMGGFYFLTHSAILPERGTQANANLPQIELNSQHSATFPSALFSSAPNDNNFFTVSEATNHLRVVSDDLYLVKLGTLRDTDEEVEICIDVKPSHSQLGSAGVFVGYRQRPDRQWEFQTIQLLRSPNDVPCYRRTITSFHADTPGSRTASAFPDVRLASGAKVNILTLQLSAGQLKQVAWNGVVVEEIAAHAPGGADGSDVSGIFGVFADKSVAVFSNYRLNKQSRDIESRE